MTESTTSTPTPSAKDSTSSQDEAFIMPLVDVVEDASGITLYADMPGVRKDQLDLHMDSDTLTLAGAVQLDVPEGMEATHAEISLPRYRRVFTLSRELDTSKVTASFEHGVLTLRIPKAEHAQPRRIAVQVA